MAAKMPIYLPAVLMLGVVSQVTQVILLRELLMVFHGNELSIGIILAAWLAWVGAGSGLGVLLALRSSNPLRLLALSAVGIFLLLPLTIWLIRGLRRFFAILPGAYLSLPDIIVSSLLILAPICLLLGVLFVLLSKLWREKEGAKGSSGARKVYLVEASGNMLGGLLFTFLLVHYLNAFQAGFISGILLLLAVSLLYRKPESTEQKLKYRRLKWLLPTLAVLSLPFLYSLDKQAHRLQWQSFMPQHQLVEARQSKHGTIAVVRRKDQYSFFQSGHLIFSTAGPKTSTPGFEKQEAVHFAHLAMVQHPEPRRVLLIGGGLRGTLSEILRHSVEKIDYIELDSMLTAMARPYISPATSRALDDPRVQLVHADGRLFVRLAEKKYDMIIVDLPDPITAALNRFYTREFFREATGLLQPGGVFVIGTSSTPDLRGTAIANRNATIYHTLNSVFTRVLAAGEHFMFYFATNTPEHISLEPAELIRRHEKRGIQADGFSAQHFFTLLPESQLRRVNWIVSNHGRDRDAHLTGPGLVPVSVASVNEQERMKKELPPIVARYFVNTDLRPIAYYYTLMFWDDLTRPGAGETFRWLLRIQLWWIFLVLIIPVLAALFLRIFAKDGGKREEVNFGVLYSAFVAGLSSMVMQIAMLFTFQSAYGFVFEMLGLIMALFMGGLALGTYLSHRKIGDRANLAVLGISQLISTLFAVATAFLLPQAAIMQSLSLLFVFFSALTFIAGLINGFIFALSVACYSPLGRQAEKTTGAIYGVELFGACLGAVVVGTAVAPILGIASSFLLAGIANATALLVLLITGGFLRGGKKHILAS